MEFVFPHAQLAPGWPTRRRFPIAKLYSCEVAAETSSKFRRVCATRAATIGFFYAMLQKDHATEYHSPLRKSPSRRWLDAKVLRISDLFYWAEAPVRGRDFDCRGLQKPAQRLNIGLRLGNLALARPRRPNDSRARMVSGEPDSSCRYGLSGDANKRPQFCRAGPRTDPFGSARLRRRFRQAESCSEPRRQSDELFALDDRRDAPSPTLQAWVELAWLSSCRGSTSLNETRRCRASSQSARRGKPRLCTRLTRLSSRSEG